MAVASHQLLIFSLYSHNSAYSVAAITLTTVLPRAFEANHRDIFAAELSGTFVVSVRIIVVSWLLDRIAWSLFVV